MKSSDEFRSHIWEKLSKLVWKQSKTYASYTKVTVSSGFLNTRKPMNERGSETSAFIVFECLETLMKHEARVYRMASPQRVWFICNKHKSKTEIMLVFSFFFFFVSLNMNRFVRQCDGICFCVFYKYGFLMRGSITLYWPRLLRFWKVE